MTEQEEFMYQIMGKVYEANAPLVFKGAMITKLILAEGSYTALERQTGDIDANWVGIRPTMDTLVGTINDAISELKSPVYAEAFREYGEKMSAGISIREKQTNEEIISMDIDIRPIHGSKLYHYGEINIKGVLVNEILADKISVLSKKMIFRRAKDIVDVYALAHCAKVSTSDIQEIYIKTPDREVGPFYEFFNCQQDIKHAYEKLRGIENKPSFEQIYEYVKKFVQPFTKKIITPRIWNSSSLLWEDVCTIAKP